MSIQIPEVLTSKTSERYKISIRFFPDGYSFSGFNVLERMGSFFYTRVNFESNVGYAESFKSEFFSNEVMSYPYQEVNLIFSSSQFTLVPDSFYDVDHFEALHRYNYSGVKGVVLSERFVSDDMHLLFDVDKALYEFCSRSYVKPKITHYAIPLMEFWKRYSEKKLYKQLFVQSDGNVLLMACYEKGQLLFANSYVMDKRTTADFYILYVWKKLSLDALRDSLLLSGDIKLNLFKIEELRTFINNVNPVELPSEAYLLGEDVARASTDVIALSLCES